MKKIVLVLSAIILSIGCKAQSDTDVNPYQEDIEKVFSYDFGFDRQMSDIYVRDGDIYCSFEIEKEDWKKWHNDFSKIATDLDTSDFMMFSKEKAEKVKERVIKEMQPDSCMIYAYISNDAIIWNDIAKEQPAIKEILNNRNLKIHVSIKSCYSDDCLTTYTITRNDLDITEEVTNAESKKTASFLYFTCYAGLAGIKGTCAVLPYDVDEHTIATRIDINKYLITFDYLLDDSLMDIPGMAEQMKEIQTAQTRLRKTRLLKYLGYKMRYIYWGKKNPKKVISFVLD